MRMPCEFALENALDELQKSSTTLKMKELYYQTLNERAQRIKRHSEEVAQCMRDLQAHHEILMI